MMSYSYEFEKYLTDIENIKETIQKYGVAICPILDNNECNEMINDKWNLLEYLTNNFEIPINRNNKDTYKQILELYPNHKMLLQHWYSRVGMQLVKVVPSGVLPMHLMQDNIVSFRLPLLPTKKRHTTIYGVSGVMFQKPAKSLSMIEVGMDAFW